MDVAVLVSPTAGRGRAGVLTDDVLAAFRSSGLSPRLLPATTGADAERQAAEAVAAGAAAVGGAAGDAHRAGGGGEAVVVERLDEYALDRRGR